MVNVHRLERWQDMPGLLARYFHPREISASLAKGSTAVLSLSARFAAKEAYGKALGTGLAGIVLKDILVINAHNDKPEIEVFGTALEAFLQSGANRIHISLTHERDYDMAIVLLEHYRE